MTTAMVRCMQPGCGGTIQDGYCDTCGLAAPAATSGPSAPSASAGPAASVSSPGSSPSTRSRARSRGSSRSARGRLGAGLVDIPPVPYRDPASAVVADPQVPEAKRYCSSCDTDAMAAAVAERQFLAEVEHPNIVRIYNFVQHADRRTGELARRIELVELANAIRPRTLT